MAKIEEQLVDIILSNQMELIKVLQRSIVPRWLHLDISPAQIRVLFVLAHTGPVTMGTIAEKLGVGLPTASHLVEKLVRAQLVNRNEDPTDRRHMLVQLTTQGDELIGHLQRDRQALLRSWLSKLTQEELIALNQGLQALVKVAQTSTEPK
jgi:DNA-binding MarR family transcriptional regulator